MLVTPAVNALGGSRAVSRASHWSFRNGPQAVSRASREFPDTGGAPDVSRADRRFAVRTSHGGSPPLSRAKGQNPPPAVAGTRPRRILRGDVRVGPGRAVVSSGRRLRDGRRSFIRPRGRDGGLSAAARRAWSESPLDPCPVPRPGGLRCWHHNIDTYNIYIYISIDSNIDLAAGDPTTTAGGGPAGDGRADGRQRAGGGRTAGSRRLQPCDRERPVSRQGHSHPTPPAARASPPSRASLSLRAS